MSARVDPRTIAIIVKKRNAFLRAGRPQKWRWVAISWDNRRKLAVSGEFFINQADALLNAVILFADASCDPVLLEQAHAGNFWRPSNVFLIQDGISGMQVLRRKPAA